MSAVLVASAAVFVLLLGLGGAVVGSIAPLLRRAGWLRGSTPWAVAILLPLVLALAGSLALFVPMPFSACHCQAHGHHPHICFVHPALAEPLLGPAAVVLAVWLAVLLPGALRLGVALIGSARRIHALRKLEATRIGQTEVRFVDAGVPTAFTAGVLAPVIVLDRALWGALPERDRAAVLHHEHAHIRRWDALSSLVLRLGLVLQPWLPSWLFERWQHEAEVDCDRHAAEHVGDPAAVAETLVSVGRLRSAEPVADPALLGVFGAEQLEARVTALLDDGETSRGSRRNDVIAILFPVFGLLALVLVWPGDLLHHAVETVIGLLHL